MDMISQLPEHIIHDILSYLPNKDSARTCVLSRTWRHLHATKPIMVFNYFEFDPHVNAHSSIPNSMMRWRQLPLTKTPSWKKELFMNYVDCSLRRFFHHQHHENTPRLRKFDLTCCICDDGTERDFGCIDQWLHDVIHHGTDTICLHIISYHEHPYSLPQCVLASQMLHELCLSGSLLLDACRNMNLPSLLVLTLCNVHNFDDDLAKGLFSGCQFVEVLRIKNCRNLVHLQASSLSRLVELSIESCSFLRTVEIGSLTFESFSNSHSNISPDIILLGACKTLRKLKHEICSIGPKSPFHQLSTFIQLEELVLEYVDFGKLPKMRISSQSLKRLVIRSLLNMRDVVEIECPNLHAMEYTSNLLPFHSVSPLNPKNFRLEFHLLAFQHGIWLEALQMLIENGFNTTKYPKAIIVLKDHKEVIILDLDGGLIEIMFSLLCRVEDLESTSKIIMASSFGNLKNEILIPMPPYMAFNMVSSCASNFSQIFSEKLSRIIMSCDCIVEKDRTTDNIPFVLREYLSSSYQVTRIVSKWDWTI